MQFLRTNKNLRIEYLIAKKTIVMDNDFYVNNYRFSKATTYSIYLFKQIL